MNNDILAACLIDGAKSFLEYSKYYRRVGDAVMAAKHLEMAADARRQAAELLRGA
ncbi:hypothetical protein [Shewanella subflava]|uniref:Uncharacterized protein n=1 Tax=Shewanella subflava TaxID=2986476 RepID=A0ABT3ICH9_9GAMM|nr:hypothetical protein [Shewanella subflava]MCW3173760.1 hypothetical protein [Shewanella subflava]